jgi:hypothetical protein
MKYLVFIAQADWTFILPSELPALRAAPLAEKNAAAWHHVLKNLISLHHEHSVFISLILLLIVYHFLLGIQLSCKLAHICIGKQIQRFVPKHTGICEHIMIH